jgi:HAD superfamily hydrolase (TIGR01509 family)
MQIEAILFDLDGVILDSEKVYKCFWKNAASELGFCLSDETILSLRSCDSSIARRIVNEETGSEDSYDLIRSKRKILMSEYLKENSLELKAGVMDFLSKIADLPIKKVIVTAASPEEKKKILDNLGISRYIDDIVSVKDVKRNKPFPDIYWCACDRIGVSAEKCIAIEDAPNGVKSAYDAGIKVIMIPDLSEPDDNLRNMCYAVFDRIDKAYSVIC